jgi:4-carboxymuconolactone decarboxylase
MKDQWFDKGLATRRKVLSRAYVDRQLQNADAFTKPMQDLVTAAGWGMVWSRPGLTYRERSMLTLAFTIARGKAEELALHLDGATRNGVTQNEVREICVQSAIYCGFPEGLGAFRVAKKYYAERAAKQKASAKPRAKTRTGRRK